MSESRPPRRLLVGIDLSAGSIAAAELTIEIASALGAEVSGVFVEEDHLLVLAAHPLVREMDTWSATNRELDTPRLERRMRAQGRRARQIVATLAQRRGVPWSFRTIRGPATATIRSASENADIVTLGRVGWSTGEKKRLGGTVRALLTEGEHAVLIPGQRAAAGAPVIACYDGSESSERGLAIAAALAGPMEAPLEIELLSGNGDAIALAERAQRVVAETAPRLVATRIESTPIDRLASGIRDRSARLVVVAQSDKLEAADLAVELAGAVLVLSSRPDDQARPRLNPS